MQIRLLTRAVLLLVCSLAWGDDLITAVKAGDANAVESMIKQGVDVDAPEANGTTALHWAVYQQDAPLVKRLLEAHAKVSVVNQFGSTPMQEAALTGNAEIIKMLLTAGADVESANAEGQTALMVGGAHRQRGCRQGAAYCRRQGECDGKLRRPIAPHVGCRAMPAGDDPNADRVWREGERARRRARLAGSHHRRAPSQRPAYRGIHSATLCRAGRGCGIREGADRGRRGHQP